MTLPRARPRSLYAPERFLSREACRDLLDSVIRLSTGGGDVQVSVRSRWTGNVRWSRNQATSSGDTTMHHVSITRYVRGAAGSASTNQVDDESLRSCVRRAETLLSYRRINPDASALRHAEHYLETDLWSDSTFHTDASARAEVLQRLVESAAAAELHSHGYLEMTASGNGVMNSAGLFAYQPQTRAELSVTVRNSRGTGSGWAGTENKDWLKIDGEKVSARAVRKCRESADPVAVEPGRYTVILEPQAVADLMIPLVRSLQRVPAESGLGPWAERATTAVGVTANFPEGFEGLRTRPARGASGESRLGKRVLDERITLSADPRDPDAPFLPFGFDSLPYRAVTWIDNGILRNLAYDRSYALRLLNRSDPLANSTSFRMSGGTSSLEEMISSTARGMLITRFVNVREVIGDSLLCSGSTSDGVWLVEDGRISKAVKNFRFRESPLFAFNNVESLGTPERVLLDMPAICPPVKVRDFSLTSLADAV